MSDWGKLLTRLSENELIVPILENQIMSGKWPDHYEVVIDSGPYYGHGDGCFHPSTHPLLGARRLYYEFHPDTRDEVIKEKKSLQSHMTLSMGAALHGVVQTQFQMTGLLTEENTEWEYHDKVHNVRGRVDFIIDHPNGTKIPVEMKTRNSFAFGRTETILPSWDAQLSLGLDNYGADMGILLMVESGFPYRMKEFRVQRNVALLDEIYEKFDHVRDSIRRNVAPKYCCSYDSETMKSCPARHLCWLKT